MWINTQWWYTENSDKKIYEQYADQIMLYLWDKKDSFDLRNRFINNYNIPAEKIRKDVLLVRESNREFWFFWAFDNMLITNPKLILNNDNIKSEYRSLIWSLLNIFKSWVQSDLQKSISEKEIKETIERLNKEKLEIKKSNIKEMRYQIRLKYKCSEIVLDNIIKKLSDYIKEYSENKYYKHNIDTAQKYALNDIKKEYKIKEETLDQIWLILICIVEKQNEWSQSEQLSLF